MYYSLKKISFRFVRTVFFFSPRYSPIPVYYFEHRIDLPPTHKPPPVYEERIPSLPQKNRLFQVCVPEDT